MSKLESETLTLKDQVEEGLQEIRVVLPGTQALLGFQFATFFTATFENLTYYLKYIHLASLGFITASIIVLMSAVAFIIILLLLFGLSLFERNNK